MNNESQIDLVADIDTSPVIDLSRQKYNHRKYALYMLLGTLSLLGLIDIIMIGAFMLSASFRDIIINHQNMTCLCGGLLAAPIVLVCGFIRSVYSGAQSDNIIKGVSEEIHSSL